MTQAIGCPSKRVFNGDDIDFLRGLARSNFIRFDEKPIYPFISGHMSRLYVGGREDLSLDPWLFHEMCDRIRYHMQAWRQCIGGRKWCLIGIPDAATGLAGGVSARSSLGDFPIAFLTMHKDKKTRGHYLDRYTDAPPDYAKFEYASLDNVVSYGTSKVSNAEHLAEDGFDLSSMRHIVLVDYDIGSRERLATKGIDIESLFRLHDLIYAFRELEVWPSEKAYAAYTERDRLRSLVA